MKQPCKKCGERIFNKQPHSEYCKDCTIIVDYLRNYLGQAIYRIRKRYPNFNIKLTYDVKIIKNDPKY